MAEENNNEELRIGVYVCHCGVNVGGVVDCPSVAEYAKSFWCSSRNRLQIHVF